MSIEEAPSGPRRAFDDDGERAFGWRGWRTLSAMPLAQVLRRLLRWLGLDQGLPAALEAEQDRWFLWTPILLGTGIGLYFALPVEPSALVASALVVGALGLWRGRPSGLGPLLVTSCLLWLAIGFGAAKLRTVMLASPMLSRELSQAELRGWIEDVEPKGQRAWRVTLRVLSLNGLDETLKPFRVRIRVIGSAEKLLIGRAVAVRAKLSPPPIPAIPGDYDFARRAYYQKLGGVGFARSPLVDDPTVGAPPLSLAIWQPVENVRRWVARRINQVLSGDRAAIAVALIQGDQGAISESAMNTMRNSGLAHILSISGLHMAIAAGAIFWVVRALLALSPVIAQLYQVKTWAAVGASIGAFLYLLLSGCQVPAVRSFIMIELMFLAMIAGRRALSLRNVALAALILLLLRPESMHDVSFLMSFAATAGLVALYEDIGERRAQDRPRRAEPGLLGRIGGVLAGDVLTSVVAGLAVAPLGAYYFHKYQQYSVLGNLLALPIVSFWLMPLVLIVMVAMPLGLDAVPLIALGHGIDALLWVGALVAGIPGAITYIPAMPVSALIAIMLGGIWFGLWRRRWRWLGLVPIGAGLALATTREPPDILVGRDGMLVAVRRPDHQLSALGGRGGGYELARWLEHDGDRRTTKQAANAGGYRCDSLGCTAVIKGRTLAVVAHPAALSDDCTQALIVIVRFPRSAPCRSARLVIDLRDIRARGPHAVYLDEPDGLRVVTVADSRGERPWSLTRAPAPRRPLPRVDERSSSDDRAREPSRSNGASLLPRNGSSNGWRPGRRPSALEDGGDTTGRGAIAFEGQPSTEEQSADLEPADMEPE